MITADSYEKNTNAKDNQNGDNNFQFNICEAQMIANGILERFFDWSHRFIVSHLTFFARFRSSKFYKHALDILASMIFFKISRINGKGSNFGDCLPICTYINLIKRCHSYILLQYLLKEGDSCIYLWMAAAIYDHRKNKTKYINSID